MRQAPRPASGQGQSRRVRAPSIPRFQQPELVGVALDVFRQDGNVVIAQIDEAALVEPRPLFVFGLRKRDPPPRRQAAIFVPDDDDEEVALTNLFEADVERPSGPGAEELHRVVTLLDAKNGVEDRLALLLEVVEGAAEEHSERRGHRVSLRPIEPAAAPRSGLAGSSFETRLRRSSGRGLQQTYRKTSYDTAIRDADL